ncbi:hypothetical protein EDC56_0949 [Sinobacterium caligoides]|uniref:Uncharacterized protein n=1 Tax=Sinobacterium caligoides TaxID=933926 RepID=A0A3N2E1A1_9GAMM|nr:hypothetical protein [Sinobacterium caligoides]ROS05419.1 hypothetical protein EDC56_0949 [Sinobacterium caligoides]
MMEENEKIVLSGEEAVAILKDVELMLISLHRIGSAYTDKPKSDYASETCRFIDEWKITHKLADIRSLISEKFDTSLGDDDMDDLERAMEDIQCWSKKGDVPD